MSIKLAISPVTWGVDFADSPNNPPWQQVIDDIVESGLPAMELGPVGYLPEDPEFIRSLIADNNLLSAGSFIFDEFHDPDARERLTGIAERVCRLIAASGGTLLSLIDKPDAVRVATAGRPEAAPRLDDGRWAAMLEQFNAIAAVAREFGVHPVVHPHVGGYVEFEDEVERLVAETDLDLCLDTGHLAYARMDPALMIRRHADRLAHVHFKDIRAGILARVDAEALTFWQAIAEGIFCPVGEGVVDVADVLAALDEAGYDGFATIEQDRVPGTGTPLDDVRKSVAVIENAGAVR